MTFRKLVSVTVSVVALAFACSKQGMGERCLISNGNQDCEDGLECQQPANETNICNPEPQNAKAQNNCSPYRCCNPAGEIQTDSRCQGYTTPSSTETGGADAGTAGASSAGNTSTAGSSSGGASSTGGSRATGGNASSAGTSSTGGQVATGGSLATGGVPTTGGAVSVGGSSSTGGVTSTSST